jgi:hypothetical protein
MTFRKQLLGLGVVAASSLLALHSAQALTGPQAISIDGGPLGTLSLSGGVDGIGYYSSDTNSAQLDNGATLNNELVELQGATGPVSFTVEVGGTNAQTLGALSYSANRHLLGSSTSVFTTGPLYAGYLTVAVPGTPVSISAGQLASLEGYEAGVDYFNAVQLNTALFYVENSQARGVEAAGTYGPVTATVEFGDAVDSGVFNTVQALISYAAPVGTLSVFGTYDFGKTGPNTFAYGGGTSAGIEPYANENVFGAYYSYTLGNLNVVPEVQYVYAKTDHSLGIDKTTSNTGAALFGTYAFGTSPYSVGAWAEYDKNKGAYGWFIGPNVEAEGLAVSPTWQYKDLFARATAGYLHLSSGSAYGDSGTGKNQVNATLEAGLLF